MCNFCLESRGPFRVRSSSCLSFFLPPRYRPAFSGRFEFQIRPRLPFCPPLRVGRRGNNRLSSVSTRLCTVICFRPPVPCAVICVTDTAIYGAVSLVTSHFYLWRHPVCIRIDSVIYFAADSDAGSAASRHEKANFEAAFRSSSAYERCVRRNDYVIIFSRPLSLREA